jgi:hypothetical protein
MKEIEVNTFSALHEIIETYDARTVIYRGMKSVTYPLMPKIGRIAPPNPFIPEKRMKRRSCASSRKEPCVFSILSPRMIGTGWRSVNKVGKFIPKHISPRITTQGVFLPSIQNLMKLSRPKIWTGSSSRIRSGAPVRRRSTNMAWTASHSSPAWTVWLLISNGYNRNTIELVMSG